MQEIIAETTEKLQETIAQKEKTQRALDCTRTVLHKTEGERAEQVPIFGIFFDRDNYLYPRGPNNIKVEFVSSIFYKKFQKLV